MGYDFMVDQNLKTWLIEINENPCLSTLSVPQKALIEKLVDDTMKLTIDSLFGIQKPSYMARSQFRKTTNQNNPTPQNSCTQPVVEIREYASDTKQFIDRKIDTLEQIEEFNTSLVNIYMEQKDKNITR